MKDKKPVPLALDIVLRDVCKASRGKMLNHWVGHPKKMTRDRPGQEAFLDTWGKKCLFGFFYTACSIFDIDLLGEFLLWVGGPGRTSHTAPFIVPIKNSSTEPVSGWGIIGTSISDPKAMAPKRAVCRIGDFHMLCRWSYNPLVFPSQHTLCLLRPRDHMQLEQNCTQVARRRQLYTQVRAPWPFLPPSRRECQQSTRPPVIITCKQSQLNSWK